MNIICELRVKLSYVHYIIALPRTTIAFKKGEFQEFRPRGYKTFFILNSTENEISAAHKNYTVEIYEYRYFLLLISQIMHLFC